MDIVPVGVDDEMLGGWYAAFSEGLAAHREAPTNWTLPELAQAIRAPGRGYRWHGYAAVDAGVVIGGLLIQLPLLDNLTLLKFEIGVPPARRRRGVGSALFGEVVERARAEGRTSLLTQVVEPYRGRGPVDGVRFAEKLGCTRRNRELHQVLDLPVAPGRLDTLARHAAERQGGYQLRSWTGPCPDDLAEAYVELRGRFMSEVPLGEMEYEPERWDLARLRAEEARHAAQQRTAYTSVAVAPDGRLVGNTVLVVPGHDPQRVYQHDTLVLPEHRGHRLGLALKVANLRAIAGRHPDRRLIHTWNAEDNGPMLAVNEALGFRSVERMGEFQRDL